MKVVKIGVILLLVLVATEIVMAMTAQTDLNANLELATPIKDAREVVKVPSEERKDLPSFIPGKHNRKIPQMFNYTPTPPLPESELVNVLFSKAWLLKNDKDPRPDIIEITFPKSWMDSPQITNDEPVALLRIPKKMLALDDQNEDPGVITVSYPTNMFKFYQNEREAREAIYSYQSNNTNAVERKNTVNIEPETSNGPDGSIDFGEWYWFCNEKDCNIIRVTGLIDPSATGNPGGAKWDTLHEREVYLNRDGDIIEFISEMDYTGYAAVWVAVWDESVHSTPKNWLIVDVPDLRPISYYLYMDTPGYYDIWLYDPTNGKWYYNTYYDTDNPGTLFQWLSGSTEIDTENGNSITADFFAETYPIKTEWVYIDGLGWRKPYHSQENIYHSVDYGYGGGGEPQPNTYVMGWFDSKGNIITRHESSDKV